MSIGRTRSTRSRKRPSRQSSPSQPTWRKKWLFAEKDRIAWKPSVTRSVVNRLNWSACPAIPGTSGRQLDPIWKARGRKRLYASGSFPSSPHLLAAALPSESKETGLGIDSLTGYDFSRTGTGLSSRTHGLGGTVHLSSSGIFMSRSPIAGKPDHIESGAQRFVIHAKLGSGGIGEVFLAEDRVLKRQVAMKAIRREHSQDRDSCERLLQEAERASQLADEHIASIYDVVEHDGRVVVIMEYVDGETLRTRIREPLTTEQGLNIGEQCLAGLATAHNHGVLHCDLKPENLMITRDGLVKILDFGFARPAESESTKDSVDLTCPGSLPTIGGTPAYMAPEVVLGRMPDKRSDLFSLGAVLDEAVAGV